MDRRLLFVFLEFSLFLSLTIAQTTPVLILKQINRQNEDGSYNYGYENADGSYKIETKSATGEIRGKYGYIDEYGKIREIEYGASERGFEPVGPGITVAPPTIHAQNENYVESDYDDGQYREDPSIYYKTDKPVTKFSSKHNAPQSNFKYESTFNAQPIGYNLYRPSPYNSHPSVFRGHPASNFDQNGEQSYTINYKG